MTKGTGKAEGEKPLAGARQTLRAPVVERKFYRKNEDGDRKQFHPFTPHMLRPRVNG